MISNVKKNFSFIKFFVFIALFCVYILPTGIIDTSIPISKFLFILVIGTIYILTLKKLKLRELLFVCLIFLLSILSKNINYLMFITLIFIDKILYHKDEIKNYLLNSKLLYICLLFSLIYSLYFFGTGGRYAFTAIKEINQSGLAIFCLALMLIKKNKKIGYFTLFFGLLTISRSYYIAFVLYFISKLKIIKKLLNNKLIKLCNYTNLTILSSLLLILLGFFYIEQYKLGNIYWGDNVSNRLYTFLDYSNFFRFVSIINLIFIFKYIPHKLLFGMTESEFISFGARVSSEFGIPYKYIVPHNLFYSHLKIYGIFSFFETLYVSKILKQIVNKDNFMIYISLVLYSVILGAGLYSYWLYISVFVLLLHGGVVCENLNN